MKFKNYNTILFLLLVSGFISCVPQEKPDANSEQSADFPPEKVQDDQALSTTTYNFNSISEVAIAPNANDLIYTPAGIGGGGAMAGISMSPYSSLWFVGTDMGTLFRSVDYGKTWQGVSHFQTTYDYHLENSVGIGFSSNPNIVFHAPGGVGPVRSVDAGRTWKSININLAADEKILYWKGHSYDPKIMFAATNKALWQSTDSGVTWVRIYNPQAVSKGTYIDYGNTGLVIFHATPNAIMRSIDGGKTFRAFFKNTSVGIRSFTGGRDSTGATFAFIDNDGKNACQDMAVYAGEVGDNAINNHYAHCGFVWVAHSDGKFYKKKQIGGDFIRMAENDSKTVYVTGSTEWIRGYGTKVWKSIDGGNTYSLKLHQYDWDKNPYSPWGQDKIEYSAVAVDVGWWDSGYVSFDVNQRKSSNLAGTGFFFLFSSLNSGEFWNAPFTKYSGAGFVSPKKYFKSTGLEMTSVYRFKFHPVNTQVGYAAMADVGGIETEDGGKTFRIAKTEYNSNYDYAFDPNDDRVVWAAAGAVHDYPMEWHANAMVAEGGVYESHDRGLNWKRVTPNNTQFNRQFLSVGFDAINDVLYAGSQGDGIAISNDRGVTWQYFNNGLPAGDKIIPQIEIDPKNGDVYALVTGDAPKFSNQSETGIYLLESGSTTWKKLRGNVEHPADVDAIYKMWYYPTSFAVDFSEGSDRSTLWLTDYENNGNWLASGVWKSTNKGANWKRVTQYTHPTSIVVDQKNPNKVYVNGVWDFDWGKGGLLSTKDGGLTWSNNDKIPYQHNARSVTLDPNDNTKLFYTFFGNGMLYGPRP